jgi:hypothetical protein
MLQELGTGSLRWSVLSAGASGGQISEAFLRLTPVLGILVTNNYRYRRPINFRFILQYKPAVLY